MANEERNKLTSNTKIIILLSCMIALLVASVVLNSVIIYKISHSTDSGSNNGSNNSGETAAVQKFFDTQRSNRETARAEEFMYLDAIIKSESASDAVKASAEQKKLELAELINKETVLETIVKALGYEDAVVAMSKNLNIVVSKTELTSEEIALIVGRMLSETDYTRNQIYVIAYTALSVQDFNLELSVYIDRQFFYA